MSHVMNIRQYDITLYKYMYVCYMFITVCIEATYVCVGGFIEITQCIVVNKNCYTKKK